MLAVVSYDLHYAPKGGYDEAHALLKDLGLYPTANVSGQSMKLPQTVVFGEVGAVAVATLRQRVLDRLGVAGLKVSRIIVVEAGAVTL